MGKPCGAKLPRQYMVVHRGAQASQSTPHQDSTLYTISQKSHVLELGYIVQWYFACQLSLKSSFAPTWLVHMVPVLRDVGSWRSFFFFMIIVFFLKRIHRHRFDSLFEAQLCAGTW